MDHPHLHAHPEQDADGGEWAATMAAHIELEAEVLISFLDDASSLLADLCRRHELDVRRVIDIGCGPGVGTAVLADRFPSATVVAVDGAAEMLERAAARAERLGLSGRVETRHAEVPSGFDGLGTAEVVWAAMVLHHLGDEAATLRSIRSVLAPGGLVAIAEFGEPVRFLSDSDMGFGRPGLWERLDGAGTAWLESTRPGSPAQAASSVDYPTMLEAAGFEVVVDQVVRMHLEPPLAPPARRVAVGHLEMMRRLVGDQLETADHEALEVLIDEHHPLGIMQRPDAFLHASRHLYVARAAGDRNG